MLDEPTINVLGIVLQSNPCSSGLDCVGKGYFFDGLSMRVEVVMGMAAFLAIVLPISYMALHYWSKTYVVPTTVLVLSGGVWVSMVPPVIGRIAWIMVLLAVALGLFGILWAVLR